MRIHALHKLYQQRLSQSTRPFLARGGRITRCTHCMLLPYLCICPYKKTALTNSAFLLLMYDDEILKPSNTGRLIADLVPDTFAYIWSRTEPSHDMLQLLNDPEWQPIVIFPAEYSEPKRLVDNLGELLDDDLGKALDNGQQDKRILFILLDGSWAQAKKMFRKSPYLDRLPVLSFSPENVSRYLVRKSVKDNQLATAEVASLALSLMGEEENSKQLALLFDVFKENYMLGKERKPLPDDASFYQLKETFDIK